MSLLASSYVEEEHQTWYFLSVTVWLALASRLITRQLQHSCRTHSVQSQSENQLTAGVGFVLVL